MAIRRRCVDEKQDVIDNILQRNVHNDVYKMVLWCIQKAGEPHFGNSFMLLQNGIYNFQPYLQDYMFNHITVLFASVEVLLRR
jgi:hypothetical protein